ncbi:choice-of-anchor D domain-containing protein [Pseudomarimonas salicorniae]|uniref:Choice-of-anchor D domain-containing protein n=1 Tax=Pseudomarimonas salicorniae TaxID=2933270 RepID=A0ABT0GF51_9GAMM|nr:choice-of-anchor D domain-containing protein [Lysobacter sp. CAU 1642]MCK7592799.1 choice-of-anchor D domain-containing protein [Lysobacter sp. CAU 1642]
MHRPCLALCSAAFSIALLVAAPAWAAVIVQDTFEDGDANGWTSTGDVSVSTAQAIGSYSLRLRATANSVLNTPSTGFTGVSVSMSLAATSLETGDDCYAEVSTNGGGSWTTVVLVQNGQDNGTFFTQSVSPAGADNNPNLKVRFRSTGGTTGDYCYDDEVLVSGTAGGGNPAPDLSLSGSGQFGSVTTGNTADRLLTVSNTGTANLVIVSLNGLAPPFAIQADACSQATLPPAASCNVTLRFAPTATGSFSDTLNIPSNDPDQPTTTLAVAGTGSAPGGGGFDPNFDPLTGNGNVSRSLLTYSTLMNGPDPGSRVDLSAYAVPANAAQPDHLFEGSLELFGEATGGGFAEIKDDFAYTGNADTTRKHLPEFDFEFVQTGTHLFPVARGTMTDSHPEWEYILEAGRVWKENGDNGYSRASIPFTLHQKNANCMHNGVMSFLFKADGSTSRVAYQISSETCLYFKVDMWGSLAASYTPMPVANADGLRADYQAEVNGRMPVKPISALATDHPGADPSQFGASSETDPAHVTLFGFIIDGVHYTGGCQTRYGTYPYCNSLVLPSYSSAKSVFAGLALMRMELKYPGFSESTIAPRVPDCAANGNWGDVKYRHAIDMGTGNYGSALYMSDEGRSHTNNLFLPLDHASKISYSCTQYSRKVAPGTKWVYHTSDTYILGTAMNAHLKTLEGSGKDIFADTLVAEILAPIGTSPTSHVSRRTYDAVQQPFTGWGMSFLRDDVAKITRFINVDDGRLAGTPLVNTAHLDAAMQRSPGDRGLDPLSGYKYNNGFWAHEIKANVGCPVDVWVPFMSGYGGISVLLLPNDTTYYMFSDDDTYLWMKAAVESHRIRSLYRPGARTAIGCGWPHRAYRPNARIGAPRAQRDRAGRVPDPPTIGSNVAIPANPLPTSPYAAPRRKGRGCTDGNFGREVRIRAGPSKGPVFCGSALGRDRGDPLWRRSVVNP